MTLPLPQTDDELRDFLHRFLNTVAPHLGHVRDDAQYEVDKVLAEAQKILGINQIDPAMPDVNMRDMYTLQSVWISRKRRTIYLVCDGGVYTAHISGLQNANKWCSIRGVAAARGGKILATKHEHPHSKWTVLLDTGKITLRATGGTPTWTWHPHRENGLRPISDGTATNVKNAWSELHDRTECKGCGEEFGKVDRCSRRSCIECASNYSGESGDPCAYCHTCCGIMDLV